MRGVVRRRGSIAEYFQDDKRLFFNASMEPELPYDPFSKSMAWSKAQNVRPNCILCGTGFDFDIGSSAIFRPVSQLTDRPVKITAIVHYWGRSRNTNGQSIVIWCTNVSAFQATMSADGSLNVLVRVSGAARIVTNGPVVPLQQPVILAMTYDGTNIVFYTSLGERSVKPSPVSGDIDYTGVTQFWPFIGGIGTVSNATGIIGDSALFSVALTQEEIESYFSWCRNRDLSSGRQAAQMVDGDWIGRFYRMTRMRR